MFGMKKIACLTRKVKELENELTKVKNELCDAQIEMTAERKKRIICNKQLEEANAEKKKIAIRLREQTNADIAYLAFKVIGVIPSDQKSVV